MMTRAARWLTPPRRSAGATRAARAARRGRVLVVGAPGGARLGRALARHGFQTVSVGDGAEALLRLRQGGFAAVLLADELPGIPGQALLPGLRVAWPEVPVIFVARAAQAQHAANVVANGAHACLVAPMRAPDVLRALLQLPARPGAAGQAAPSAQPRAPAMSGGA